MHIQKRENRKNEIKRGSIMKLKKIYSVVLAGLMAFPLVGCKSDELQSKIDDLQAKIAQQEQTIAGLQTQNG